MDLKGSVINIILKRNYHLARLAYGLTLPIRSHGKTPLVIYQMGKVGSTTIVNSLQTLDPKYIFQFHVHVLTPEGLRDVEREYYGEASRLFQRSLLPETKHIFVGHYLRSLMDKGICEKRWKIVTLVRDPIARNVSYFFHSSELNKINGFLPAGFHQKYRDNLIDKNWISRQFLKSFPKGSDEYNFPLTWFDTEFNPALGIDVFKSEFPKDRGYEILRGDFADILLLRLEEVNTNARAAFSEFLDFKDFTIVNANTASEKSYYNVYKDFLGCPSLSADYVNSAYESRYAQHFYSSEQLDRFRSKWHRGAGICK